eukprot:TRINITY_DN6239_c0_g2_i1.p1 TRINITY_DN6239_c0_g2~~TRINITY_DN6239_c0_g2_i1.p1  ORF type:complete len:150 (-),score=17.45 TRINITY_DN6239_c0_g2_i1:99-548(-)
MDLLVARHILRLPEADAQELMLNERARLVRAGEYNFDLTQQVACTLFSAYVVFFFRVSNGATSINIGAPGSGIVISTLIQILALVGFTSVVRTSHVLRESKHVLFHFWSSFWNSLDKLQFLGFSTVFMFGHAGMFLFWFSPFLMRYVSV